VSVVRERRGERLHAVVGQLAVLRPPEERGEREDVRHPGGDPQGQALRGIRPAAGVEPGEAARDPRRAREREERVGLGIQDGHLAA
jgi:hypothetical protein